MDWKEEASAKLKRKNQILFAKNSEFLQDLSMLIEEQSHRTLALWAFDLAEEAVEILEEKYPGEARPRAALELSRQWARGKVKMPVAKRAILDCHAVAKEIDDKEAIALCHAVGQACAVVHTVGHALGFPIYDLTATICRCGSDDFASAVLARKNDYIDKLFYWREHSSDPVYTWAPFMLK